MRLTSLLAQAEHHRELPFEPIWFGAIAFGGLLLLMIGLLVFGKGRPHS